MKREEAQVEKYEPHSLQSINEKQTEALTQLSEAVNSIANFITNGGITKALSGYARSNAVQGILSGLASNGGRDSLDARVLGQNAIEIVTAIEKVYDKYQEVLEAKAKGEVRDPEREVSDYMKSKLGVG